LLYAAVVVADWKTTMENVHVGFRICYHDSNTNKKRGSLLAEPYTLHGTTSLAPIRDGTPTHNTCFLGPKIHPDDTDQSAKGLFSGKLTAEAIIRALSVYQLTTISEVLYNLRIESR
jgi:hypothetical protein